MKINHKLDVNDTSSEVNEFQLEINNTYIHHLRHKRIRCLENCPALSLHKSSSDIKHSSHLAFQTHVLKKIYRCTKMKNHLLMPENSSIK